jgi:hypothetical protein
MGAALLSPSQRQSFDDLERASMEEDDMVYHGGRGGGRGGGGGGVYSQGSDAGVMLELEETPTVTGMSVFEGDVLGCLGTSARLLERRCIADEETEEEGGGEGGEGACVGGDDVDMVAVGVVRGHETEEEGDETDEGHGGEGATTSRRPWTRGSQSAPGSVNLMYAWVRVVVGVVVILPHASFSLSLSLSSTLSTIHTRHTAINARTTQRCHLGARAHGGRVTSSLLSAVGK